MIRVVHGIVCMPSRNLFIYWQFEIVWKFELRNKLRYMWINIFKIDYNDIQL